MVYRIWPTTRLLKFLLLPVILSALTIGFPWIGALVWLMDASIFAILIADLLMLKSQRKWECNRQIPTVVSIGKAQKCRIELKNLNQIACKIQIIDFLPTEFETDLHQMTGFVSAGRQAQWSLEVTPKKRGSYLLSEIQILVESRLGFWLLDLRLRVENQVRVYPDVHQISEYTLLARRDRLSALGVRKSRSAGSDNEFEKLREYVPGDDPRHIDWRATARRRELTVRSFQNNQSQRIFFLIDSGRMMAGDVGDGLSPLDHLMNAVILLSHVALLKGDQVGLAVFSDRLRVLLLPEGGPRQLGRLIHALHDIHPEIVESRFDIAFEELRARCRRRGLVIFATNLFDEFHAKWANECLAGLSGHHVPLALFLQQPDIMAMADNALSLSVLQQGLISEEDYCSAVAAADLLNERHELLQTLRGSGSFVMDVDPREITAELINKYLEIKAKQLI